MFRVAFLAVQRQVLCLELRRVRQAQLVDLGQLDRLDRQAPLDPLVHRAFKALLAQREKLGLRVQLALLARQVQPQQFRVQLDRPDLRARLDRQGQLARQDRQVFKATSDQPDLLVPQARLDQLDLPGLLGRKVFKA